MMKPSVLSRPGARAALLFVALFGLVGCIDVLARMTGAYTGPQPASDSLADERVIVRQVQLQYQGQIGLIVERVRFAASGDWHNVNRVVKVSTTAENQAFVTELDVQVGEILTVTTEFHGTREASGSYGVPRWPGHGASEYPIGSHFLTAVARDP